jgi:hypothetical protein
MRRARQGCSQAHCPLAGAPAANTSEPHHGAKHDQRQPYDQPFAADPQMQ